MKNIEDLFCGSSQKMSPYTPIEPPDQIAKRLGINEDQIVKLDANENPFGTSPEVLRAIGEGKYYHIYPDPAQVQLRESISKYAGCDPEMVVAGTGADELIDLVCRLALEPGENVISFTPTFSYYSHVINLNKGVYKPYPRESDFSISLEIVKNISMEGTKIVILCSPNNPSGNILDEEILDYFLTQNVIVLVDEAYFEFSKKSYIEKVRQYNNLIVLRTFSKCFGLAGLRVGYGVASKKLISAIMRIKPPYSVNVAAEVALKTCLENLEFYQKQMNQITEIREWTQVELEKFDKITVFPSQSNFILCKVDDYSAKLLQKNLEQQGILVRYFETDQLKNYIRVSVGTMEQMRLFIERMSFFIS